MYSEEIENVIAEYLNDSKAEYAVMIDGEWGSGKTYFLTHSLMRIVQTVDIGKNIIRKYAYVSLYGTKSIEEISKEIVFQFFGKKNKKKVETADAILETASNILTASLGAVNIDASKIKDTLAEIDINNWIICFDDLERCCLPVNDILGYMNRLVEHNKCKVIVLANEKEIGKINLNQRLEDKYQVVLSGRRLLLSKGEESGSSNLDDGIDVVNLQKETKNLFNEDILYQSIREKVIGLTIKYEPQMDRVYDSIVSGYSDGGKFKKYLEQNKDTILKYFEDEECYNLRTLIFTIGSIKKVFDVMVSKKYDTIKHFDKIMESFQKYIVLLTIYYKNGGKIRDLNLETEIGYVHLGQSIFNLTRGYKVLEKYCTTLSFSEEEFSRVVSALRQEYEEEEKKRKKLKLNQATAYSDLAYWWEKEDEDVKKSISQLRAEVKEDKYPFNSYQGIIGQLMVLEYWKYNIGDMDALIDDMNQNIENSKEVVDIERHSFSFEDSPALKEKYDEYVDRLKLKAGNVNQMIKASEVSQYMNSENWAEELLNYCDKHYNEFIARYAFIDLLDAELFLEKVQCASVKELRLIKDIFKKVYGSFNINEFFVNDIDAIKAYREKINQITFEGINKPLAKDSLISYLDDVIKRLEKESYVCKI